MTKNNMHHVGFVKPLGLFNPWPYLEPNFALKYGKYLWHIVLSAEYLFIYLLGILKLIIIRPKNSRMLMKVKECGNK